MREVNEWAHMFQLDLGLQLLIWVRSQLGKLSRIVLSGHKMKTFQQFEATVQLSLWKLCQQGWEQFENCSQFFCLGGLLSLWQGRQANENICYFKGGHPNPKSQLWQCCLAEWSMCLWSTQFLLNYTFSFVVNKNFLLLYRNSSMCKLSTYVIESPIFPITKLQNHHCPLSHNLSFIPTLLYLPIVTEHSN